MPDFLHDVLYVAEHLLRGRYGSWLNQPEIGDPCQFGRTCSPLQWNAPYELRKLTVKYARAIAGAPTQDAAMTTHHFLNLTDGNPDATWTDADFVVVENAYDAFWTAIKPRYAPETVLSEYNWRKDGPAFRPHSPAPGGLLSPTVRAVLRTSAGTGTTGDMMPPQVAITVTEVTSAKYTAHDVEGVGDQVRNRWGRFYLPAPAKVNVVSGRLPGAGIQTQIADAAQIFYNTCVAADLIPVMYSPTTGSAWSVDALHVDDIYDVVRSRRFVTPISRAARTVDAP